MFGPYFSLTRSRRLNSSAHPPSWPDSGSRPVAAPAPQPAPNPLLAVKRQRVENYLDSTLDEVRAVLLDGSLDVADAGPKSVTAWLPVTDGGSRVGVAYDLTADVFYGTVEGQPNTSRYTFPEHREKFVNFLLPLWDSVAE